MTVRVLFFGPLTGLTGAASLEMDLQQGATIAQLLEQAFLQWPALRDWDAQLLTAINLAYARRDEVIPPGAEVAIMPPVQGG